MKAATLICARADAPYAAKGTVFHHVCERCFSRVMLAPSGQEFLRRIGLGNIEVVCQHCYVPEPGEVGTAVAPLDTLVREIKGAVRNLWRARN